MKLFPLFFILFFFPYIIIAQGISASTEQSIQKIEKQLIEWRRHFHSNPELSNREFETNAYIVKVLKSFKHLEVKSPIAKTGVIAILKGKEAGPVIALRADIDALPVEEKNDLPFKSVQKKEYNGEIVPVMHACGHDAHTAILLSTAKVLTEHRDKLKGTVVFLFQPAEEGAPKGEEGGAALMIKEGALESPKVSAIFGLHITSGLPSGNIHYTKGAAMASSDWFTIKVKGKGSHGARPWGGRDPIQASAGIIQAIQSIVSRRLDITQAPAVITVGKIHSGLRANIIPDELIMEGTIRTLNKQMQTQIHDILKKTVANSAKSFGVEADITIFKKTMVTVNDHKLTDSILPSLLRSVEKGNKVMESRWVTGAEDFSFFSNKVPGVYFWLGALPESYTMKNAPPHHTSIFLLNEKAFLTGVRAFINITNDMTNSNL